MDWTGTINKVDSMIGKYGADIHIEISTPATYNPSTDSYTKATTGYDTKGLFTALEDIDEAGHVTIIESGLLLVPSKGLPRIDDNSGQIKITHSTHIYQPKEINTLQPGGDALLYKIRIK